MGSRYEVEVTVSSARDLKNVNWRNGDLKPYAVLWIDAGAKCSTRVDLDNAENPTWDEKVLVPLPPSSRSINDAVLYIDVVHANASSGVKPLVGSATVPLRDVDVGGARVSRNLRLKRPSGRPHGRLDVRVAVREPARYYDQGNPYPAPSPYGGTRDSYNSAAGYGAPAAGGAGYGGYAAAPAAVGAAAYASGGGYGGYGVAQPQPYAAAPPAGYPSTYGSVAPPQAGYPSTYASAAPPPQAAYGGAPAASYGSAAPPQKSKMGMGTGIAVGAAAGVLGGLALAGGASLLENKFEEHVAERVEDRLDREDSYGGGGGGGGGGYDDYGGDDDY